MKAAPAPADFDAANKGRTAQSALSAALCVSPGLGTIISSACSERRLSQAVRGLEGLYGKFPILDLSVPIGNNHIKQSQNLFILQEENKLIDFQNASFLKLKPVDDSTFFDILAPMLVSGEKIIGTFQSVRDGAVFTDKRIFAINVQGITGKKKDFTSLPYSRIQAFSVESAGVLDLDSELELWFSGLGKIKFEFVARANISAICRMISEKVL